MLRKTVIWSIWCESVTGAGILLIGKHVWWGMKEIREHPLGGEIYHILFPYIFATPAVNNDDPLEMLADRITHNCMVTYIVLYLIT